MARGTVGGRQLNEMTGCVCCALRHTARALTQRYDRALKPYGIRATQLPILVALQTAGTVPLGPLAGQLGMERTTLLRNLRPLVRRDLVAQSRDGASRRTALSITPAGRRLLKRAYPAWKAAQAEVLRWMGGGPWSRAARMLNDVARRAATA